MVHWLQSHMLPCYFAQTFGFPCPGCGMQRSIIALLQGHLAESFRLYPALFPLIITLLLLAIGLKFEFKGRLLLLKSFFMLTVGTVIIHYIIFLTI